MMATTDPNRRYHRDEHRSAYIDKPSDEKELR